MRLLATNFSLILMLAKFSLAVNKEKEDREFMEHVMEIMDKPETKEFMALEGLVTPKIEPSKSKFAILLYFIFYDKKFQVFFF